MMNTRFLMQCVVLSSYVYSIGMTALLDRDNSLKSKMDLVGMITLITCTALIIIEQAVL